MMRRVFRTLTALSTVLVAPSSVAGQSFETVGHRAMGMAGAFVAVANDSSATWWNPAGLATGPFFDAAIARATGSATETFPASRTGMWSFALATPPLGASYYRLRITDIRENAATGAADGSREDRTAGVGIRSLSVTQFGATVLHTITTGVNAGATVKYVRGSSRETRYVSATQALPEASDLLDAGDDLEGGVTDGTLDLDVGMLVSVGAVRVGATVRNLRQPRFGDVRLERQVRAGAAFDGTAVGTVPLTVSVDADVQRYETLTGERQVVAVGGEHWVRSRWLAVRSGVRFNTVGARERTVTAGASIAPRAGMFVDGYAAFATDKREGGWGLAARVSF